MSNTRDDEYIYNIEESKEVALVTLNRTWQYPDKINIIYYYLTPDNPNYNEIDYLYAIGKSSGFGPEHYSIVQSHEETLVISVGTDPNDVSQLIYGQKALCFCNPDNRYPEDRWYLLEDVPNETDGELVRTFTELTEEAIYRNLDDGFRWFFSGGTLKREDNFVTLEQVMELLEDLEDDTPPTMSVSYDLRTGDSGEQHVAAQVSGSDYYLPDGTSRIFKPRFSVTVTDHKGNNVTEEYTISLSSGAPISLDSSTGQYIIFEQYTSDFTLTVRATKESTTLSSTIRVWFPFVSYYGNCNVNSGTVTINEEKTTRKIIYNNLTKLTIDYNLQHDYSYLLMPTTFAKFTHIYDSNSFEYINDYNYVTNFQYKGNSYNAYIKKDLVTLNPFRQIFTK